MGRADAVAGEARDNSGPRVCLGLEEHVADRIDLSIGRERIVLHSQLKAWGYPRREGGAPAGALLLGVCIPLAELPISLNTARTERRPFARSPRSRRKGGAGPLARVRLSNRRLRRFFLRRWLLRPGGSREEKNADGHAKKDVQMEHTKDGPVTGTHKNILSCPQALGPVPSCA